MSKKPQELVVEGALEEELVTLLREGGKAADGAIRTLYDRLGPVLLRFFVHLGVSGDDAEDILQETIIKIVGGVGTYSGEGKARAWMWQIARNCLTDHLRKQGRLGVHEVVFGDEAWRAVEETTAAPAVATQDISVDECVAKGLETFGQKFPDRAFVLTLQMEGLSVEEIGGRIERTSGATKQYLSQSRKKIEPFIAHCAEWLIA